MHWYNVFTVVVAGVVGVLSPVLAYSATQRATRKQLNDALTARLDADLAEHRRWLRDRTLDVYMQLLRFERKSTSLSNRVRVLVYEGAIEFRQEISNQFDNALEEMGPTFADAFASDSIVDLTSKLRAAVQDLWLAVDNPDKPDLIAPSERLLKAGRELRTAIRHEIRSPVLGASSS
jgi:hypothetical protein